MLFGLHFISDTGQVCQVVVNTTTCHVFLRATINGAWSSWRRVDVERNADGTLAERVAEAAEAQRAGVAMRLQNPMRLALTGDAVGTVSFDGSQNVEMNVSLPALEDILNRLKTLEDASQNGR